MNAWLSEVTAEVADAVRTGGLEQAVAVDYVMTAIQEHDDSIPFLVAKAMAQHILTGRPVLAA